MQGRLSSSDLSARSRWYSTERKYHLGVERVKDQTTVAMDFGRISIDENLVLYLFGTPGSAPI